jgi:hypothetical protein
VTNTAATQQRPKLKQVLGRSAPLLVVIVLIIVGAIMTGHFLMVKNVTTILEQSTGLGLVSVGQTYAVLTSGIDLSVGSVKSMAAAFASGRIDKDATQAAWIIPMLLVVIALLGMLNGVPISVGIAVVAAAIIGGGALSGGRGTISCVPCGAAILVSVFNLVLLVGAPGRQGGSDRVARQTRQHRRHVLGSQGQHGPGDIVLSGANLAAACRHDRGGQLAGGNGHTARIDEADIVEKGFDVLLNRSGERLKIAMHT